MLSAINISKAFTIADQQIPVLNGVSLAIYPGEFIVIQGSSGSGKTTLLTLLSGLDKPTSGEIYYNDNQISGMSEEALAPLRNQQMGFVFQSFHLIPSLTALENVMFPAELNGNGKAAQMARNLVTRVGMWPRRDNFPSQLSGGEKQRIALCRAVINRPEMIFADEPTGNLDSENGQAVLNLLLKLRKDYGATLIMVTHSAEIAAMANRIVPLKDGQISKESVPHGA